MKNNEKELRAEIKRLREESDLKTGWISLISHDFKENFSSLLWVIEAVQNETVSKEAFFKLLPSIKQDATKNLQTVMDTSEWLKTQYGDFKPQITPIFIYKLFLQLKEENEKKLSAKKIDVEFHGYESLVLTTDRHLILFILNKVLDNAIKYSKPEQRIHFEVDEDKHCITLSITDFGIGMNIEHVDSLFSFDAPVFKGTNDEIGAGLSLKIVRDFVNLLDGKMEIDSTENKQTKFSISLPKNEN